MIIINELTVNLFAVRLTGIVVLWYSHAVVVIIFYTRRDNALERFIWFSTFSRSTEGYELVTYKQETNQIARLHCLYWGVVYIINCYIQFKVASLKGKVNVKSIMKSIITSNRTTKISLWGSLVSGGAMLPSVPFFPKAISLMTKSTSSCAWEETAPFYMPLLCFR